VRAQVTQGGGRAAALAGEKTRNRSSSVRGTTAERLLTLQRTAGNAAVAKAVRRGRGDHDAVAPVIQRVVWTFNASTRTNPGLGQQDPGLWFDDHGRSMSSKDLRVDPRTAHHGDTYDDTTSQHHDSGNITFSQKGAIPQNEYPKRETGTRKAVVEAKQKLATVLAMLGTAGDRPSGPLLRALKSGFPAFQTAEPQQIGELLPRITEVLQRVQKGLNAQGTEITLVGKGAVPAPDVAGWVNPSMGDRVAGLRADRMRTEKLPSTETKRSGPIHLTKAGEEAWTIIHEATHRFAGTLDFQYSPYTHEVTEDAAQAGLAPLLPAAEAAAQDTRMLGKRVARAPESYSGRSESGHPKKQQNWYAMGRRALMNADSYAHFIMTATGSPVPRG
jgi:hypothetical protein